MENVPSIEVEPIETPINPSGGVEISVNLDELQGYCSLQWNSVQEDGYEFLDLNTVVRRILY